MKKAIKERILPFFKKNLIIALIVIMVIVGLSVSKLNVNTVDKLVSDTATTFITVSIIKGGADLIEGSTILGVEVGDVVQPVLDAVELVWKFLIGALAFWGCMKLFLTLPAYIALVLLALALVAYITNRKMGRFIMFCSFVCSLIPFIIFGTGLIINLSTEPLRADAQQHFDRVAAIFDMSGLERGMMEEEEKTMQNNDEEHWYDWVTRPFKSATIIISQTKRNITFFTQKAKEIIDKSPYIMSNLVNGTWKYIVVLLMNSILIPGLLFLFFYKLGKSMQPDEEDKQIIVQAMLPEPAETKLITAN